MYMGDEQKHTWVITPGREGGGNQTTGHGDKRELYTI